MEFRDDDIMIEENKEDDLEFTELEEKSIDELYTQFQEAADLPFFGKGKRKSCRAVAKVIIFLILGLKRMWYC